MICMSDTDIIRFYVDLPKQDHRRLRVAAVLRGVTMKQILLDCIKQLPEPPANESRADVERLAQGLAASCLSQPRKEG